MAGLLCCGVPAPRGRVGPPSLGVADIPGGGGDPRLLTPGLGGLSS